MEYIEKAILTVLCMVFDGEKQLLQDRIKKDWKGFTLPGGHVEKEESFVKAIIREIKEETGLTIYNPRLCGIKQFQTDDKERYIVLLFKTNEFDGTLFSSDEGNMVWVNRSDLKNIKVANGFFDTLKIIDDEKLTELFYKDGNEKDEWIMEMY